MYRMTGLLSLVLSASAIAQTPTLTASTTIAIAAIKQQKDHLTQEVKNLESAIAAVNVDVMKQNPGYHLNPQTLQLEKDPEQKKLPEPEKKK